LAAHTIAVNPGVLQKAWPVRYLGGLYYFILSAVLMEIDDHSLSYHSVFGKMK